MHKLVALGKLDPTLQKIATWIRLSVPEDVRGSSRQTADAVFHFVRKHGVFQRDPFQIEKIEHPIEAMRPIIEARKAGTYKGPGLFVGDCDTLAGVYLATLGGILGFQYAFETAKVDMGRPDEFSHVWVAFRTDGDWYPLDPSTPGVKPGWRPPVRPEQFKRWQEKEIEGVLGMSGNNGLGYDPTVQVPEGYFNEQPFWGWGDAERNGRPELPQTDPGDAPRSFVPAEAAQPASALFKRRLKYLETARRTPRERDTQMEPYNYEPTPNYFPKRPYISIEERGGAGPSYPFARTVEVLPGDPITVRKENGREIMPPEDITGMGAVANGGTTSAAAVAPSIWDSMSKALSSVLSVAPAVYAAKLQASYATKLAKATNSVAGQSVVTQQDFPLPAAPTEWYKSPIVWVGGVLVIGGVAYAMTRR